MNAADDLSDEMRANVLNDPSLFLDLDDDDDDETLAALTVPAMLASRQRPDDAMQQLSQQFHQQLHQQQQQQQQQMPLALSSSTTPSSSRFSGVGIPKLDVSALNTVSPIPPMHMQGYGVSAMTNSPLAYSRDGAMEHSVASAAFNMSSHNSSPHNATTSPNMAAFNVYSSIGLPPLCAKKLNFREFLNQKMVPQHIEKEESTGIFVGQLPSSYSEDDIEALLKAIGNEHGQTVQVRDVKSHNRDRTCAFIMINASALSAVLDFTKRVLCDINCVWVVDHSQAGQLPIFVQHMPRDQLRGVPKAALVLEKLTPQAKPRHAMHATQPCVATSPSGAYGGMPPTILSPMTVMSQPVYLQQQQQQQQPPQQPPQQQQQQQGNNMVAPTAFLDAVSRQGTSPFNGQNFMPASSSNGNGLPPFFNANAFQNSASSGALFPANGGAAPGPSSMYAMQMGANTGIANIEAANQMMIAATRSRTNSLSQHLNIAPLSPPNAAGDGVGPVPTAVQLTQALQQEHCSCGQMLYLSQYPKSGTCAKCNSPITPREVAYWCPSGHIAVCIMCALHTSIATDAGVGRNTRFVQQHGEMLLH